jgi:hypothetical protein
MPVKRRRGKGRPEELRLWRDIFTFEYDFFDEAAEAGITTDSYGRVDRAEAEEAWHRLGAEFLETFSDPVTVPWALREFGEPGPIGRRRRR